MAEADDESGWIRKSRKGDHEAFAALVRQYQRMIHALTFRMTGSMTEAEDLAQETFIRAYRQLPGFRSEAKFSSWLYRIAINLCLNWRKQETREGKALEAWRAEQGTENRTSDARLQMVQEALLKLKPKQRAAIVLTAYDGLSHGEAARVLGCSETTVSWRLFAARARLKKLLTQAKGMGDEPT